MRDADAMVLGDGKARKGAARTRRRIAGIGLALGLALYTAWALGTAAERTRVRQARIDISRIEHSVRLFRADHGRCPRDLGELSAPPAGPPYQGELRDPWGRPYALTCPAPRDAGGVVVISAGPDGEPAGGDNVASL